MILKPTFEEEVAVAPMISKLRTVVVPSAVTLRYVVEEPTAKESVPAGAFTENCAYGEVVPTPTLPMVETMKCGEEVPWSPTTNTG